MRTTSRPVGADGVFSGMTPLLGECARLAANHSGESTNALARGQATISGLCRDVAGAGSSPCNSAAALIHSTDLARHFGPENRVTPAKTRPVAAERRAA